MATKSKSKVKFKDGFAIVIREGFAHIYFEDMADRCDEVEPLYICQNDKYDIDRALSICQTQLQSYQTRRKLRNAICDAVSDMGSGEFDLLDMPTLHKYAKQSIMAGLEVANNYVPSYAVTMLRIDSDYEETEEIVLETRTFSDAVAWAAMETQYKDLVTLDSANTICYKVYPLNALGKIDPKAKPLYETLCYDI